MNLSVKIVIKGKDYLNKTQSKIKGLPQYIIQYAVENIQTVLEKLNRVVITSDIYGMRGVKKRTGTLGKAFICYARKVNQYAFAIYGDFAQDPYVSTHVGTGFQTIKPKRTKYLWIPKKGGPADVYPRKPVSAFYSRYLHVKPDGLRSIYNLALSARIRRRINPNEMANTMFDTVSMSMPRITRKAYENWKKLNGY